MNKKLDIVSKHRTEVMGFAALWIFIFHVWTPMLEFNQTIYKIECFVQRIGFCGVDIFFLLSGMGLTYSIKKSNIWGFYGKRLRRVVFPFLVVAIARCIIQKWPLDIFFTIVTGIRFITTDIYTYLWFVPAIVILYLFFPLYYRLFEGAKSKILFTLCCVEIWFALTLYFKAGPRFDMFGFTNRIPVFLIGVLLGWLIQNRNQILDAYSVVFLAVNMVLGVYLAYLSHLKAETYIAIPTSDCIPNIFISISLVFMLSLFLDLPKSESGGARIMGILRRFLAFYGKISLEFYCVQERLAVFVSKYLPENLNLLARNMIQFLCATVAAYLLYAVGRYFWKFFDNVKSKVMDVTGH